MDGASSQGLEGLWAGPPASSVLPGHPATCQAWETGGELSIPAELWEPGHLHVPGPPAPT